jgi:hypothetical protein
MQKNTLILSIALNGYQWIYRDCIDSHRAYANRNKYDYLVITRPFFTSLGVECCWLKLTLMLEALNAGYETVLFVDADAHIKVTAHKLETLLQANKYLYLAKSYSGRFNSGVILVNNHFKVRQWLKGVISARHVTVSPEHDVGWGENGHIIQHTENCEFVSTLNRRWNNTYDMHLVDHIRHFSFGPMRQNFYLNLSHKVLARGTRLLAKLRAFAVMLLKAKKSRDPLTELTQNVLQRYSVFFK